MAGEARSSDPGDRSGLGLIVLPEMVYDGIEAERAEVLRPLAAQFLDELDIAVALELEEESERPRVSDFDNVEEYVEWHLANPKATQRLDAEWNMRLGIVPQNNLYIVFGSNCLLDSEVIRHFVGLVRDEDPQFAEACRVSADAAGLAMRRDVDSWRSGEKLSREEVIDGQVARWTSDLYMTEAAERLQRLGANAAAMRSLRN